MSYGSPFKCLIFPTPVGVFPVCQAKQKVRQDIPHARGGVSICSGMVCHLEPYSPRPWGCFLNCGNDRHPQTNGICERFHKTVLHEFYQVAFRRKLYHSLEELQADLDIWMGHYNTERTDQGKMCCGRTPMQTLLDGKEIWKEKVGQLN